MRIFISTWPGDRRQEERGGKLSEIAAPHSGHDVGGRARVAAPDLARQRRIDQAMLHGAESYNSGDHERRRRSRTTHHAMYAAAAQTASVVTVSILIW